MKILIVDDSDAKAQEIGSVIRENPLCADSSIRYAAGVLSALRAIQAEVFDVLILDLHLPVRDQGEPLPDGGQQILREILDGACDKIPAHILCITEHTDIAEAFRDEAAQRVVHLIVYKESGEWREALRSKIVYVSRGVKSVANSPKKYRTDIGIVTSSSNAELRAVLKLPGFSPGVYSREDALHYFSGIWPSPGGERSVVACAAPAMGMAATCVTVSKVIERWRPRFLFMTGIAAGIKSELSFGDILVAEAAFDYGSGKILETKAKKIQFVPSHTQLRIDPALSAIIQCCERDQSYSEEIRRGWPVEVEKPPKVVLGLLATGAAVVQSPKLVDQILKQHRKSVGLDMEAFGVFQAAVLASAPQPRVLVVKSVSDFANANKGDDWHDYAAFTSSRFVYELVKGCSDLFGV